MGYRVKEPSLQLLITAVSTITVCALSVRLAKRLVPLPRALVGSLVPAQGTLVIGGIIAGPTVKTLVPLPRALVGSLVPAQGTLVIGGIIAELTAKGFIPLPRALVGSLVFCQVVL